MPQNCYRSLHRWAIYASKSGWVAAGDGVREGNLTDFLVTQYFILKFLNKNKSGHIEFSLVAHVWL